MTTRNPRRSQRAKIDDSADARARARAGGKRAERSKPTIGTTNGTKFAVAMGKGSALG